MNVLAALNDLKHSPKPAALCTVVSSEGSTPRKAGAKMIIIIADDPAKPQIINTIGGGAIEHYVVAQALEAISSGEPRLLTTSLRNDLAMCCGGQMSVFIEPIKVSPKLIIFGAGHIAQALCVITQNLDFETHVFDFRVDLLESLAFKNCVKHPGEISSFSCGSINWEADSYVVVATHDHQLDQQVIESILHREFKYLALVGSLRKAIMTRKRLLAKEMSPSLCDRVTCPAGINIHAQSPEEIAVSIAAQLIQVRHEKTKTMCFNSSGRPEQTDGHSQSAFKYSG